MARKNKPIHTDIGWSDASGITLFGRDFSSEILGHLNLARGGIRVPQRGEHAAVTLAGPGHSPEAIAALRERNIVK